MCTRRMGHCRPPLPLRILGALTGSMPQLSIRTILRIVGYPQLKSDIKTKQCRLQLDIGIIAACAPTLRPLLGRVLRLSTSVDPYQGVNYYRGANYYRAGKALDRLPVTGTPGQEYPQQEGPSGQYIELVRRQKQWEEANNGDSSFLATAVHAEHVQERGDTRVEKCSSDEDAILPLDDSGFKGIVKTMEIKVEK
jgi:hypothetical protein